MRKMRFLPSRMRALLWVVAASALGSSNCDDTSSGRLAEDPAPPRLMRVLVQDETAEGGRYLASDLLSFAVPHVTCDEQNPCIIGECETAMGAAQGTCTNPLDPLGGRVEIGTPIEAGGISIRLVFSKALDPAIQTVKTDPKTGAVTYELPDDILRLLDQDKKIVEAPPLAGASGEPFSTGTYFDPAGSPTETSDPVGIPYGPALVLVPGKPLDVNSRYTIEFAATRVHDRAGQVAVDAAGAALPAPYRLDFMTEDLAVLAATPDVTADEVATIAPNDVIQLQLNAGVDEATATVAFSSKAGTTYKGTAWSERGADPTACDDAFDDRTLDLAAVSDMGDPILLPAGDYTVRITGLRDNGAGRGTPVELTGSFTVKGDRGDPATDPAAIESHVRPSQCRN